MPSNQLDFANFFATTLASTITASDTVVYLNSLPTPSEGYLVIEPDSTTAREIIYYTSKGANYVTCPSVATGRGVGGTTASSHSGGATVQMNVTAEDLRGIQTGESNTGMHTYFDESFRDYVLSGGTVAQATGLIASISSGVAYINGRRLTFGAMSKTFTASKDTYVDIIETDGSNIATVSYTELASGATGSAPVSNGMHIAKVNTTASAIATSSAIYQSGSDSLGNPLYPVTAYGMSTSTGAWASWIPVLSSSGGGAPLLGNATVEGKYIQIGKTVHFRLSLVLGSTTSFGIGTLRISLPVTQKPYAYKTAIGTAYMEDAGVQAYIGFVETGAVNSFVEISMNSISADGRSTYLSGSVPKPFAWGTGDYFSMSGTYEAL